MNVAGGHAADFANRDLQNAWVEGTGLESGPVTGIQADEPHGSTPVRTTGVDTIERGAGLARSKYVEMKFRRYVTGKVAGGGIELPGASGQLRVTSPISSRLLSEQPVKKNAASGRDERFPRLLAIGRFNDWLDRDRLAEFAVARKHGPHESRMTGPFDIQIEAISRPGPGTARLPSGSSGAPAGTNSEASLVSRLTVVREGPAEIFEMNRQRPSGDGRWTIGYFRMFLSVSAPRSHSRAGSGGSSLRPVGSRR